MRELIQKLVAAEAEAKSLVAAARAEAGRIVEAAQKDAQEVTVRSRREARGEAEAIIGAATEEARRERHERLVQAQAEIEIRVRLDEATKQVLVEAVVRCVCSGA